MPFLLQNKQKTISQAAYFGHLYMLTNPKLQMPLLTNSAFLLNTDPGEGARRRHVAGAAAAALLCTVGQRGSGRPADTCLIILHLG